MDRVIGLVQNITNTANDSNIGVVNNTKSELNGEGSVITGKMDAESHVVAAIKEVGLDDTVWVPKIQESLKLDNIGLLKSVGRGRFESFLEQVDGSQRSALLEVYAQVTSFDPQKGSSEQSFVIVSRSEVIDMTEEDCSIADSGDDILKEKTLRVEEIFEDEKRNLLETDQAQRAKHHIASTDHDVGERNEKDDSVNPSQEDVNQLEYDVKEKKKDEHSRQFPMKTSKK